MSRSYRIFKDLNYAYFVTWTIVDWLNIFSEDLYRQVALDSLAYIRSHKKTELNAFVLMPSHIHAILCPNDRTNLSDVIRDFKRFTSRKVSNEAEKQNRTDWLNRFIQARQHNRASDVSTYQVWQEGSHPEAIFTEKFARQKMDYIHLNPVRAGLVHTADEWHYSSARAYLLGEETYPPTDLLIVR
jgi:REP element-mobilizing transposase RayT